MENLWLSIAIVLPVFLMMGSGFVVRRLNWVDEHTVRQMNGVLFRVFLPILLCNNIRYASAESLSNPGIYLYVAAGLCLLCVVCMGVVPRFMKDKRRIGVMVQGLMRSNYALLGLPLVASMFPGEDMSVASLMVVATVPFYNMLSVICLQTFCGGEVRFGRVLKSIARNPLIIGCAVGIALMLLPVNVPSFVDSAMRTLGSAATPLALFLLGAAFSVSAVRENRLAIAVVVLLRLFLIPAIFVLGAALLGYRGVPLASVYIAFGAPGAVSSYTMAQQMGGDADLANHIIVFTTLFSILSMVAFIFFFKQMGWV